ncbi:mechanosensitive ion channel domain-containing protein [Stenotrophomonas sp. MMGLT7]|uniref:mechanosensitive ion channel family protein n=1 Tax=Stenotrophomonas sp. MMGLT7 TaxID=2901227 RepID=UPI001E28F082|nr:mechanosensitive ion channel family protein [Stenotrophomonas sp. MMGLT7]
MKDWKNWFSSDDWLPVLYALLALAVAGILTWLWMRMLERARMRVRAWKGTRIQAIRFQKMVLLSEERIVSLLTSVLGAARLAGCLVLLVLWAIVTLNFFPATQQLEEQALDYVTEPLASVAMGIVHYIPKLMFIVFAVVAGRVLLKGVYFFFHQIELGTVRFRGFHPDWAGPTYQLAKTLVVVFVVIIIFPYLPAASSGAFKGISVFLGVLVSLGSSSAVGNIVSGVVLTYMRPYQVDDYVRIAQTEGRVIERSLLLTRVQTPQNEIVTIPNAQILSGQMVNYSGMAAGDGVILHMPLSLGYQVPFEKIEPLLIEAVRRTPELEQTPAPYVMHVGLDNTVARYELNAYTRKPLRLPYIYSDLRFKVQAVFAEAGVDLTSPVFYPRPSQLDIQDRRPSA